MIAYLSSKSKEYGQIASFTQCPISSPEVNVELSPSNNIALSPPVAMPSPPPLFRRPSNISENPEWSPLWLTPPLRKMVPLPTYQMSVITESDAFEGSKSGLDDSEDGNPEPDASEDSTVGMDIAASQPADEPDVDANDSSLAPFLCQEPSPVPIITNSIELSSDTQITFISRPIPSPVIR